MSTYHISEGRDMSLDNDTPSRIPEFRHLFAGNRRIVASIRVDEAIPGFVEAVHSGEYDLNLKCTIVYKVARRRYNFA